MHPPTAPTLTAILLATLSAPTSVSADKTASDGRNIPDIEHWEISPVDYATGAWDAAWAGTYKARRAKTTATEEEKASVTEAARTGNGDGVSKRDLLPTPEAVTVPGTTVYAGGSGDREAQREAVH